MLRTLPLTQDALAFSTSPWPPGARRAGCGVGFPAVPDPRGRRFGRARLPAGPPRRGDLRAEGRERVCGAYSEFVPLIRCYISRWIASLRGTGDATRTNGRYCRFRARREGPGRTRAGEPRSPEAT